MNDLQKAFNKLFAKGVIIVLALLAILPITPFLLTYFTLYIL